MRLFWCWRLRRPRAHARNRYPGGAGWHAVGYSRLVTALLYRVAATDVTTYLCLTLALVLTGILATCVPAWRAIKADPLIALRHE